MTEAARRRTRARIRLIKIQWLLILVLTVALAISVITRPSASVVEPIVEEPRRLRLRLSPSLRPNRFAWASSERQLTALA